MNYIKIDNGIITDLAIGTDIDYYISQGYEATEKEVITGYDGKLYFKDECPEIPLDLLKQQKLAENKDKYEARFKAGVCFNDVKYDCDSLASLRISGQLAGIMALDLNESITWFDYDFKPQTLTVDEFKGLASTVLEITRKIEALNCQINVAITNATTINELNKIKIDYVGI